MSGSGEPRTFHCPVRDYKAAYGKSPTGAAAIIYDAFQMLLQAAEKAHSTDPKAIAEQLEQTGQFVGVCGKLKLGEQRDVIYSFTPRVIRNGKIQTFEDDK